MLKSVLVTNALLSLMTLASGASSSCQVPLDILFVLDASDSMIKPLHDLTHILYDIMRQYDGASRNVRLALAAFGGQPSLLLPFVPKDRDDRDLIRGAFRWLEDNAGSQSGFTSQKSGLEALRMVLNNNTGYDLKKSCVGTTFCNLNWRSNAERLVVLVTDDASDLPVLESYRTIGQTPDRCFPANPLSAKPSGSLSGRSDLFKASFQPAVYYKGSKGWEATRGSINTLTLDSTFKAEVDATAQLLQSTGTNLILITPSRKSNGPASAWDDSNAYCNSLKCKTFDRTWVGSLQYGNPDLASFTNSPKPWSTYNYQATKTAFLASPARNSLAGQLFASGAKFAILSLETFLSVSHENKERMFLSAMNLECKPASPISLPLLCGISSTSKIILTEILRIRRHEYKLVPSNNGNGVGFAYAYGRRNYQVHKRFRRGLQVIEFTENAEECLYSTDDVLEDEEDETSSSTETVTQTPIIVMKAALPSSITTTGALTSLILSTTTFSTSTLFALTTVSTGVASTITSEITTSSTAAPTSSSSSWIAISNSASEASPLITSITTEVPSSTTTTDSSTVDATSSTTSSIAISTSTSETAPLITSISSEVSSSTITTDSSTVAPTSSATLFITSESEVTPLPTSSVTESSSISIADSSTLQETVFPISAYETIVATTVEETFTTQLESITTLAISETQISELVTPTETVMIIPEFSTSDSALESTTTLTPATLRLLGDNSVTTSTQDVTTATPSNTEQAAISTTKALFQFAIDKITTEVSSSTESLSTTSELKVAEPTLILVTSTAFSETTANTETTASVSEYLIETQTTETIAPTTTVEVLQAIVTSESVTVVESTTKLTSTETPVATTTSDLKVLEATSTVEVITSTETPVATTTSDLKVLEATSTVEVITSTETPVATTTSELKVLEFTSTVEVITSTETPVATTTSDLKVLESTSTVEVITSTETPVATTTSDLKVLEATSTVEVITSTETPVATTTSDLKVLESTSTVEVITSTETPVASTINAFTTDSATSTLLPTVESTLTSELKVSEPTTSSESAVIATTEATVSTSSPAELVTQIASTSELNTPTPSSIAEPATSSVVLTESTVELSQPTTVTESLTLPTTTMSPTPTSSSTLLVLPTETVVAGNTTTSNDPPTGESGLPVGAIAGAIGGVGVLGASAALFFKFRPGLKAQLDGAEMTGNNLNPLYSGNGHENPLFNPDSTQGWDQVVHTDLEASTENLSL